MIVVADASPLNYLILIGHVDVLQQMYGRVDVPADAGLDAVDQGEAEAILRTKIHG